MLGKWAREILTFLTAFLGFWILLYNLHCEEYTDIIKEWEGRAIQHLPEQEWSEPWTKQDHTFFTEYVAHIEQSQTDSQLVMEFNRFASHTNLGMQIETNLNNEEESEGDSAFASSNKDLRANLIWLLNNYLESALFLDSGIPPNPIPMEVFAKKASLPWAENEKSELLSLMNDQAVCPVKTTFKRSKRKLRKVFKPYCHPLDIWGRVKDNYEFDLYFPESADASAPLIVIRKGSDLKVARQLTEILQQEEYQFTAPKERCMWTKAKVRLNLGTNGIKIE